MHMWIIEILRKRNDEVNLHSKFISELLSPKGSHGQGVVFLKLFLNYLIKDGEVTIEEFLFKEENCIVKDANGKAYTNKVIIPLRNPNAKNISL